MSEHPMTLSIAVNRASKARACLREGGDERWVARWTRQLEEAAAVMRRHGLEP